MIRSALLTLILLSPSLLYAGKYNRDLDIGKPASAWSELPGVDGKPHSLKDLKDKHVVVLAFTCNSCPYAVDWEDRMIAFAQKHCAKKGSKVALVAINVNKVKEDLLPAMTKRAEKKKYPFPYLFDESQEIARKYGATRTPEFFVLNRERKVVYMGAFDDNPDAKKVKQQFVIDAVVAALAGKMPEVKESPPVGCTIRWERRRRSRSRK